MKKLVVHKKMILNGVLLSTICGRLSTLRFYKGGGFNVSDDDARVTCTFCLRIIKAARQWPDDPRKDTMRDPGVDNNENIIRDLATDFKSAPD